MVPPATALLAVLPMLFAQLGPTGAQPYCPAVPPNVVPWPYKCVWNSPTIICEKFGDVFNLTEYCIVQNSGGEFSGPNITIFYGIGHFPYIDPKAKQYKHGGIPQLGNLTDHLDQVAKDVASHLPEDFSGLAVIDFEAWRPLFKHNFDTLDVYKKASEDLVHKEHPDWTNKSRIEEEAEKEWNAAAKLFFESTLETAKRLRPKAQWGYYGFPRCYGSKAGNFCSNVSQADNDRLQWLWDASTALYPRLYLHENTSHTEKIYFVLSAVNEAVRVGNNRTSKQSIPVYPYSRHTYDPAPGPFYSLEDLYLSNFVVSLLGATGVVIWGSHRSTDKALLCHELKDYTTTVFGPYIQSVTVALQVCSEAECNAHGQCVIRFKDIPFHEIIHGPELEMDDPKLVEAAAAWEEFFMEAVPRGLLGWEAYDKPRELQPKGHYNGRDETWDETDTIAFRCQCYPSWTGETCDTPSKM